MKKFSIMVIVAVMLFSLIACSAPATTSPEPEKPAAESEVSQPSTSDAKKTLTVAINRDPATFYLLSVSWLGTGFVYPSVRSFIHVR